MFTNSNALMFFTCASLAEKILLGREEYLCTPSWFKEVIASAFPEVPVEELVTYPMALELEVSSLLKWNFFGVIQVMNSRKDPNIKKIINVNTTL